MSISVTRKIRSLDDPLPATLYWDASFIVNFAFEAARYIRECSELLARLDESSTISYVSTLALDEACFVLLQLKIEEDHQPAKFWDVYNTNPVVLEHYVDDLERVTSQIGTHPKVELIGTEPSSAFEALSFMRAFHLLPRDAYHLATMRYHRIDSLVTMDADFLVVPGIELFTCNPTILGQSV
jgi:predicted nucleic acid-binding protein